MPGIWNPTKRIRIQDCDGFPYMGRNSAELVLENYNLGQNKWKTETPPPPQIKDGKMARFCTSRGFMLDLGGGGMGVCCSILFCPRLQVITCGCLLYAIFVVIVVVSQECSGSICLRFQLLECQCKQEENLCDLCCKNGEDGECKPIRDMGVSNITNALQQFPGAPCDNFNGYCDVFLKCRAVDADGPLSRLKNKFFSKEAILGYLAWIKEHWWAVLLMGVGLILLMAGNIYHSVVVVLGIESFRF